MDLRPFSFLEDRYKRPERFLRQTAFFSSVSFPLETEVSLIWKIGVTAGLWRCTLKPLESYSSWEGRELLISTENCGVFFLYYPFNANI